MLCVSQFKKFHTPGIYKPNSQEQSWAEIALTLEWHSRKDIWLKHHLLICAMVWNWCGLK